MYAENPKEFNKTYRIYIAHTKQAIVTIIWMGEFSSDKLKLVLPDPVMYIIIITALHVVSNQTAEFI